MSIIHSLEELKALPPNTKLMSADGRVWHTTLRGVCHTGTYFTFEHLERRWVAFQLYDSASSPAAELEAAVIRADELAQENDALKELVDRLQASSDEWIKDYEERDLRIPLQEELFKIGLTIAPLLPPGIGEKGKKTSDYVADLVAELQKLRGQVRTYVFRDPAPYQEAAKAVPAPEHKSMLIPPEVRAEKKSIGTDIFPYEDEE